ncbi:MAG: MauE/DoxX family redox-associated membrane protein [Thermomicrobiales bacterium]
MDIALLLARLLLTGVFVVAGAAKLIDREGSLQALIGFGVPAVAARPLATLLPLIELAVAVSLLPLAFAFWGAVGALGLLGLFAVGIALSMARGEAPDCHCFGQLHSEPAGWSTLVRNAILAGVAGFIIVVGGRQPGASPTAWLTGLTGVEQVGLVAIVVAAGVLAAQTWFLFQLMAQNGRLLERVDRLEAHVGSAIGGQPEPATANAQEHGLPVGSRAPAFSLPGLHGETMTLASLLAPGKPLLLLFTDPQCVPCNVLLPEISRWQREYADRMTAVVISRRDRDANLSKVNEHGLSTVLLQDDLEVYDAYQAQGTPSAVLVRPDGTIGSSPAGGARQIQRLLDTVLDSPPALAPSPGGASGASATNGSSRSGAGSAGQPRPAPTPLTAMAVGGQPAPQIALPDLRGRWSNFPISGAVRQCCCSGIRNCGFCRRMVDDLNARDADRPAGAPDLLIVSSGGADADQSIGTRIPFLLDEDSKPVGTLARTALHRPC